MAANDLIYKQVNFLALDLEFRVTDRLCSTRYTHLQQVKVVVCESGDLENSTLLRPHDRSRRPVQALGARSSASTDSLFSSASFPREPAITPCSPPPGLFISDLG